MRWLLVVASVLGGGIARTEEIFVDSRAVPIAVASLDPDEWRGMLIGPSRAGPDADPGPAAYTGPTLGGLLHISNAHDGGIMTRSSNSHDVATVARSFNRHIAAEVSPPVSRRTPRISVDSAHDSLHETNVNAEPLEDGEADDQGGLKPWLKVSSPAKVHLADQSNDQNEVLVPASPQLQIADLSDMREVDTSELLAPEKLKVMDRMSEHIRDSQLQEVDIDQLLVEDAPFHVHDRTSRKPRPRQEVDKPKYHGKKLGTRDGPSTEYVHKVDEPSLSQQLEDLKAEVGKLSAERAEREVASPPTSPRSTSPRQPVEGGRTARRKRGVRRHGPRTGVRDERELTAQMEVAQDLLEDFLEAQDPDYESLPVRTIKMIVHGNVPLPPHWRELEDRNGVWYYANDKRRITTFEDPRGAWWQHMFRTMPELADTVYASLKEKMREIKKPFYGINDWYFQLALVDFISRFKE